jgi:hypothetical protein
MIKAIFITIIVFIMMGKILYVQMYLPEKQKKEKENKRIKEFMYKEKDRIIINFDRNTGYIYDDIF